jgi:hypothetical protein
LLKKTVTYKDFNDEEVTEDLFFHLSKAELVEMEMAHEGGLSAALKRIIDAEDGKAIIAEFKEIILGSYGKKSPDGRRFIKNQQIREEFESSEAYSTLFMELVTETQSAIDFINGIVPAGMAEEAQKLATVTQLPTPTPEVEPQIVTREEMMSMDTAELESLGKRLSSGEVKLAE